jgi:hypothetical protein
MRFQFNVLWHNLFVLRHLSSFTAEKFRSSVVGIVPICFREEVKSYP